MPNRPPASTRRTKRTVVEPAQVWPSAAAVFVFMFALALRAIHLLQLRHAPFFRLLMGDALSYDRWAQRIAAGDWLGQDVFYQAPLYPYVLAVLYRIFGHDLTIVRVCQIVLGSAACGLMTLAGARLFGRRAGLIAGLLLALCGPAIFFDGLLQKAQDAIDIAQQALGRSLAPGEVSSYANLQRAEAEASARR
jgi:hypothetical protein